MKLEVGKTYVAVDGKVHGPMTEVSVGYNTPIFVARGSLWPLWNEKGVDVSRADSTSVLVAEHIGPTIWRDMTNAEKGEILLARHEGGDIEMFYTWTGWASWLPYQGTIDQDRAYRIKPEPKVVKHYWTGTADGGFAGTDDLQDTHMITFNTVDGEPDLTSIKMEKI